MIRVHELQRGAGSVTTRARLCRSALMSLCVPCTWRTFDPRTMHRFLQHLSLCACTGRRLYPNSIAHHVIISRPAVLQPHRYSPPNSTTFSSRQAAFPPPHRATQGLARSSVPSSPSVSSLEHRCRSRLNAVASSSCRLPSTTLLPSNHSAADRCSAAANDNGQLKLADL